MYAVYKLKKKSNTYYKYAVVFLKTSELCFGSSLKSCLNKDNQLEEETLEQTGYGLQLLRKKYTLHKVVQK